MLCELALAIGFCESKKTLISIVQPTSLVIGCCKNSSELNFMHGLRSLLPTVTVMVSIHISIWR